MITLIHPEINPVIVSFGELSIRWYGLSYVIGLVIGYYIIKKINKSLINPIDNKVIEEFFIWTALGVIIGGRIGYVLFYQTYSIFYNPLEIFYIWKGGMSFHGGLIGTFFSTILFSKNKGACIFWYKSNLSFPTFFFKKMLLMLLKYKFPVKF